MSTTSSTPAHAPQDAALPPGFTIAIDPRTRIWADAAMVAGGSPWRLSRLKPAAADLVQQLLAAGKSGERLVKGTDLAIGRVLLDRGLARPLVAPPAVAPDIQVVVPVLDHPEQLNDVLTHLSGLRVIVVDDGSSDPAAIARIAERHRATLIRHDANAGPGAARNTGLAASSTEIVAFIDADCLPPRDWIQRLIAHFDDPAVAAVAPRITAAVAGNTPLERYETTNSSLDMGPTPELVRPGARLGFVPSAALLVRRSAISSPGFDPELRLGEDVDLVWRLVASGWSVRYDPRVEVPHRTRSRMSDWVRRKFDYGTSAPSLQRRHPGSLTPSRPSAWNVAVLALIAFNRPLPAAALSSISAIALRQQLRGTPDATRAATRIVAQGTLADAASIGHLLRREWWPVGAVVLLAAARFPAARVPAACMLTPPVLEWLERRPPLNPLLFLGLRLVDDAAYGSGVIYSSIRERRIEPLLPRLVTPRLPTRLKRHRSLIRRTLRALGD